jgi:diacylglycerol kinase family enzyme
VTGGRRVLIVNPAASGVSPERIAAVQEELETAGPLETILTEGPGQAAELVAAACADCAAIYVFSGDGGFNEAINGMRGTTPIGFLPGGATSVLPRALGLPRDPRLAARRLAGAERSRVISLGRANGRRFGFCAGIGLDAELVRAIDRRGRASGKRPGDVAFVAELVKLIAARRGRFEPALEIEGHGRCALAVATNCDPYTYVGSRPVRATPLSRFELGLDVVGIERLGPLGLARLGWWLLARPTHPAAAGVVYLHDADGVRVYCDSPTALQVDGEDAGDVSEVLLEAERDALTVLV